VLEALAASAIKASSTTAEIVSKSSSGVLTEFRACQWWSRNVASSIPA